MGSDVARRARRLAAASGGNGGASYWKALPLPGGTARDQRERRMTPEQDQDGTWFILLPSGERKTFATNASAWRFLDRHERREGWVSSRRQWRASPTWALSSSAV